jgi:hypothetical protein
VGHFILADDGETAIPCDVMEWAEWVGSRTPESVGGGGWSTRTEVLGRTVSTVFLGLNHGFGGGPPLLWETMVFGGGSWSEEFYERHSTKAEALACHRRVVARLEAESDPVPTVVEVGGGQES